MAGESPNPIGPAVFCRTTRGRFPGDAETWKDTGVANTVNPFDWCDAESRACELVVENAPAAEIYAIDGDKLGKAERAGGSGWGVAEGDVMYTLSAKDVHGVAVCPAPCNIPLCDANGRRKDRPNGGCHITHAASASAITAGAGTDGTVVVACPPAVGTPQPTRRYYCLKPDTFTGDCDRVAAATVVAMIARQVNNQNPLIIEVQDGD